MGLYTLKAYDSLACQSKCDQAQGCQAFNLYVERDPSLDPNANQCPNPPSTTNYKCTLWGAPVSSAEATNYGQWRESFHVVIAGSNGESAYRFFCYKKKDPQWTRQCADHTKPPSLQQELPPFSYCWLHRPQQTWRRHQCPA